MSVKQILSNSVCLDARYIKDYDKLSETVETLRKVGHSISMTQGVFDLIHTGHARYLEKAKSHGDILVVAVDTDEYTRLRKAKANERRPIVPFQERLELLANLRTIDILTIRDVAEHVEDPTHVIKVVKPDTLIMSRSTRDVDEAWHVKLRELCESFGGKMELLDPQAAVTTTARLRDLLIDGAGDLVDVLTEAIENYFKNAGREVHFRTNGGGNGQH